MKTEDRNKVIDQCIRKVRKVEGDFYDRMYNCAIRDVIDALERMKRPAAQPSEEAHANR